MISLSQQASAIDTARRIIQGAVKLPTPASAQGRLLAEQLAAATETIRESERKRANERT